MSEFKNVPTEYNGRRYKSKFEAFFAAYLDIMKIDFQYEPKPVRLSNGAMYYPDFLIKENPDDPNETIDHYIEVKGGQGEEVEKGLEKVRLFGKEESILVFGPKWPRNMAEMMNDFANDNRYHSTMYYWPPDEDDHPKFCVINGAICPAIYYDELSAMPEPVRTAFEKMVDAALQAAYFHIQGKKQFDIKDPATTDYIRVEAENFFSAWKNWEEEVKAEKEQEEDEQEPLEDEDVETRSRATYWLKDNVKKMISDIAYTRRHKVQDTVNELLEIGIDVMLGMLKRDGEELLHKPKGDFE